jgi:Family of unknown function (DUF6225)
MSQQIPWTVGRLKAELADVADDTVVVVNVPDPNDPKLVDEQIVVDAGFGTVDWGDGKGPQADVYFGLQTQIPEDYLPRPWPKRQASERAAVTDLNDRRPATPGPVRLLVPDLDGGEGYPDIDALEEVLLTLRGWESDALGEDQEPMELPPPVADGAALQALQRVAVALPPPQGERAEKAGYTGRLLSPATGRGMDVAAARGTIIERSPIRVVRVDAADAAVLGRLADALAETTDDDIASAADQVLGARGIETDEPTRHIARIARRLAELFKVEQSLTEDQRALVDLIEAAPPADDLVLSADQHEAYRTLALALNKILTGGDPLARWAFLGE